MKAIDIINRVDLHESNDYSPEQKLKWLSSLDGRIYVDIILTHEGGKLGPMPEYETGNEQLLVGAPYGEDLYYYYLMAMIESENSENARYAKRSSQFNNVYKQFTDWYNRNNMPKSTGKQFI